MQMANEEHNRMEMLDSLLSQVQDYACSIRELALQLERVMLMSKEMLKDGVRESDEPESPEDDVDPEDLVPSDWVPPPKYDYADMLAEEEYDSDGYPTDEYLLSEMFM